MKIKDFFYFFSNITKVGIVAASGAIITAPAVEGWYTTLSKPIFSLQTGYLHQSG